jgi:hypothetical protein
MSTPIGSLVTVGGDSAGWMTAAYLSKALQQTVRITVARKQTELVRSLPSMVDWLRHLHRRDRRHEEPVGVSDAGAAQPAATSGADHSRVATL